MKLFLIVRIIFKIYHELSLQFCCEVRKKKRQKSLAIKSSLESNIKIKWLTWTFKLYIYIDVIYD